MTLTSNEQRAWIIVSVLFVGMAGWFIKSHSDETERLYAKIAETTKFSNDSYLTKEVFESTMKQHNSRLDSIDTKLDKLTREFDQRPERQ